MLLWDLINVYLLFVLCQANFSEILGVSEFLYLCLWEFMRLFNKLTEKPLAQFPFRIAIYWSSLVSTVAKMPLLEKQVSVLVQVICCARLVHWMRKSSASWSGSVLWRLFSWICCHFLLCCWNWLWNCVVKGLLVFKNNHILLAGLF